MIAYDKPGVPAKLHIGRVLSFSPFILVAMPLGWSVGLVGESGRGGFAFELVGGLIMAVAMLAALAIVPTGVQRIAAGMEQGLDEFELAARLRAQSEAYRWFSAWVLVMAIIASVAPAAGAQIPLDSFALASLVFWVIAWAIVLPAWFLARALPVTDDREA